MIKVASYCRVSTDKDDQANSFETQQRYFREYIDHHPDWELSEIYADEGISGTSTKKRIQFNRMIADAYEGKFSLIITKEVSRFSRNILDTISYTRELKAIGVGVLFMADRINTLDPEAEMLLSLMASLAQEESRRTSGRVVWGQTRQMEKGIVFGHSLLGYDVQGGVITVNQEGAELVRLIFEKYAIEQVSTTQIAHFLSREGYRTCRGSSNWSANTVIKILHNEKYTGDLVQKKTYTPDFLTHTKRRNTGAVPVIRIENHHEAIISREIWNLTQERLRRNNKYAAGHNAHSNRYLFSGKIRCGECGSSFVGRFKYLKDGSKIRRWSCGTAVRYGAKTCDVGKLLRDDDAAEILRIAIGSLQFDTQSIINNVTALALDAIVAGEKERAADPAKLQFEISRLHEKREAVLDSYFEQEITKEDLNALMHRYDQQLDTLNEKLLRAEAEKGQNKCTDSLRSDIHAQLCNILTGRAVSEVFYKTILDSITVFRDKHMELHLNHLPHIFVFV